jgi:hypothetical protein
MNMDIEMIVAIQRYVIGRMKFSRQRKLQPTVPTVGRPPDMPVYWVDRIGDAQQGHLHEKTPIECSIGVS